VRLGRDAQREAAALVDEMNDTELIGSLSGDTPFWSGLAAMIVGAYNERPYRAGRIERLGIPGVEFTDGPRGVVAGHATCFPVAIARGASWDPALEERIGEAIGIEARAVGANLFAGVCVNILRHPGWGRAQETYGEEPVAVGAMGAALTRGVQRHVMACVKHFACNSIENSRFTVDVLADERALHESYLPQFRAVIEQGIAAVMSAYNRVNGAWCGQHRQLLSDILRSEWGFAGFVMSDFIYGLRDPVAAISAGLDLEMPFIQQFAAAFPRALEDGRLDRRTLQRAATRIVGQQLRFAREDDRPSSDLLACSAHRDLAREAAEKSIVLLENHEIDGVPVLPVDPASCHQIAVIGALAAEPNLGDRGSSRVRPPSVTTPLEGIRAAFSDSEIAHHHGREVQGAVSVSQGCDLAVLVVGLTYREEGEFMGLQPPPELLALFPPMLTTEDREAMERALAISAAGDGLAAGGDRATLSLSAADEELICAVAAAQPRTVVVVMAGSAVTMTRWRHAPAAILLLWYPGMEGGTALGRVLNGAVNPSGKLPFAIPEAENQLPPFDPNASQCSYELQFGQRWLLAHGHHPAYPVGFGASYSTFAIASASLAGEEVRANLANVGPRPGAEVVQVWATTPKSQFQRAPRQLLGFRRVELDAGEQTAVRVPIDLRALQIRVNGDWRQERTAHRLLVGRSAFDPAAVPLTLEMG